MTSKVRRRWPSEYALPMAAKLSDVEITQARDLDGRAKREVTSERIRDKISASKRKGLWVGGMVPLGYDTNERRITVTTSLRRTGCALSSTVISSLAA